MDENNDLSYEPKELPKFTKWLLYLCLAFAMYNCFFIVALSVSIADSDDFFAPDGANKKMLLFFIADGIALFVSWGASIVVHKDKTGGVVELTKERSKNFTRYAYYMSVIMLLTILITIICVIFGW